MFGYTCRKIQILIYNNKGFSIDLYLKSQLKHFQKCKTQEKHSDFYIRIKVVSLNITLCRIMWEKII